MNVSPTIEPRSTNRLLKCLGLAIDETKLVRSILEAKNTVNELRAKQSLSDELLFLNREIEHLEQKLAEVRKSARC